MQIVFLPLSLLAYIFQAFHYFPLSLPNPLLNSTGVLMNLLIWYETHRAKDHCVYLFVLFFILIYYLDREQKDKQVEHISLLNE